MKVGVLLNENCPTFNNWKKWQGINESWHTSEMQCPSVLLDFYSQIVQITLWWPRGLTSPCRRISVKELPMCTEKMQNKCNMCDYTSSHAGDLRTHLKMHSGEKPNKCNQCDFASSDAGSLRRHLKKHSGEKSNKCNKCDLHPFR